MYIVIFCSLFAFLLTYLESRGKLKGGLKWGFFIITFLQAIHYNYGNDYMHYYEAYLSDTSYNFDFLQIVQSKNYKDPGWVLLSWLFKPIGGFFMMVAVLTIIQNTIVYWSIVRYVEKSWWSFSFAIYIFTANFYLLSFSMLRQSFVIFMFLGLWRFIEKRKWLVPLIVIWLCSFIHASSIILLPFAFWGFAPVNKRKFISLAYVAIFLIFWFFHDVLNRLFSFVLALDETLEDFAIIYGDTKQDSSYGLGFVLNIIPFVLSIQYLLREDDKVTIERKHLVTLAAISYLIIPFSQIIHLIGRVAMYFSIYSIVAIPLTYGSIKRKGIKIGLSIVFIIVMIFSYINFFNSNIYGPKYSIFQTIFSVL